MQGWTDRRKHFMKKWNPLLADQFANSEFGRSTLYNGTTSILNTQISKSINTQIQLGGKRNFESEVSCLKNTTRSLRPGLEPEMHDAESAHES